MIKKESLAACEVFRASVMLSIDNMEIDGELKNHLLISLQTFYLEMLRKVPDQLIYPEITD